MIETPAKVTSVAKKLGELATMKLKIVHDPELPRWQVPESIPR